MSQSEAEGGTKWLPQIDTAFGQNMRFSYSYDAKCFILLETSKQFRNAQLKKKQTRKAKKTSCARVLCIRFFFVLFCLFFFLWRLRNQKSLFLPRKERNKQYKNKQKRNKKETNCARVLCFRFFFVWYFFCGFLFLICFFFHKISYFPFSNEWRVLDIIIL